LVARGQEPETGEDSILHPGTSHAAPLIRPDGALDFAASRLDEPVAVGETLLVVEPGTPGAEGRDVRGETIPTRLGKQIDLEQYRGDGVSISPDGTQLMAATPGTPRRLPDQISILPLLRIIGDQDATGGSLDFAGNVVIDGDVADGVSVGAAGDILVKGAVKAGTLHAEGSVLLRQGMLSGELSSKGDLHAELLRDCTVYAAGDIRVDREIARSTVTAGRDITALKATVLGGTVTAGHEIAAGVVGSAQGTMTKIILDVNQNATEDEDSPVDGGPIYQPGHVRPSVRVHDRIFAPAQVTMGLAKFLVEHETPYCKFIEDHGNVVVTSYA
jgi:uncharacterized protein